jgi:TatD DNase family protein
LKDRTIYIDIHTHHYIENDVIHILNLSPNNTTIPLDIFFSIGLHPWFINEKNINSELEYLRKNISNKNMLAIGECGLDKSIDIPLQIQESIFIEQLKIAEQNKKTIIIHCVKAFNEVIRIKNELKLSVPFIIHGFNNNKQILEQLLKNGFYISFGKALLNGNSNASKFISMVPLEKIFLETDDADISIKIIFEAAAKQLQIDTEKLKEQIYTNFNNVFIHE